MSFQDLWEDQAAFNRLLRQPPTTEKERMEQTREIVLHTESELHELLATYSWKFHRNKPQLSNQAHREYEMVDIFKFVMTLAQIQGLTVESLEEAYWRKTAVVRQRHNQEWVHRVDRPYVVIDIDGVLCDYAAGFSGWIVDVHPEFINLDMRDRVLAQHLWMDGPSVGMTHDVWKKLQHAFRVAGGNRTMPAFDDAAGFTQWCRERGYLIVLLTSRPIDQYPNIYTDTVVWLQKAGMEFDIVWWAQEKGDFMQLANLTPEWFQFYVDDDLRYVEQVAASGYAPCYWLRRGDATTTPLIDKGITVAETLTAITQRNERS